MLLIGRGVIRCGVRLIAYMYRRYCYKWWSGNRGPVLPRKKTDYFTI